HDHARARAYAEKCESLFPSFGPAVSQLGYIELELAQATGTTGTAEAQHLQKAVGYLERAVHGDWHGDESGKMVAQSNLSAALMKLGRFEDAKKVGAEALQTAAAIGQPDYPDAQFNYGRACEATGALQEAHEHYLRALESRPDHQLTIFALKALRQRLRDARLPLPPVPEQLKKVLGE
ncbi:MAG TPA: tetratricopeptide repeat protein, partial [Planctomycetota bacterium]|nr:tetratricopeptide repeat protein [Planctomycetota bacterium]